MWLEEFQKLFPESAENSTGRDQDRSSVEREVKGNTATSPQAGQDRPITAVMILGLDETTQPRYKVTITLILGARVPKNVQIGRKNGMMRSGGADWGPQILRKSQKS